jgi:hypothetical protein
MLSLDGVGEASVVRPSVEERSHDALAPRGDYGWAKATRDGARRRPVLTLEGA